MISELVYKCNITPRSDFRMEIRVIIQKQKLFFLLHNRKNILFRDSDMYAEAVFYIEKTRKIPPCKFKLLRLTSPTTRSSSFSNNSEIWSKANFKVFLVKNYPTEPETSYTLPQAQLLSKNKGI